MVVLVVTTDSVAVNAAPAGGVAVSPADVPCDPAAEVMENEAVVAPAGTVTNAGTFTAA